MASPSPNTIPTDINVRLPSKYASKKTGASTDNAFVPPPLEWLYRTWAVTHSTLSMWRSAQNVRITYKPYTKGGGGGNSNTSGDVAVDDLVEYEKKDAEPGTNIKTVKGIDRPDPSSPLGAAFNWRGKGWLKIASSHWEILGYGERPLPTTATTATTTTTGDGGPAEDEAPEEEDRVERWAVTWFAPTLFTNEGLDIYTNRKEGLAEETYSAIVAALKALDAPKLVSLVEKDMRPVLINLPAEEIEA